MDTLAKPKNSGLYVLFVTITLIWGLSWPVNKMGLPFIPSFWFAALRLVIATLVMFLWSFCFKKLIIPKLIDLPLVLCLGFFQIGLFTLMINLALTIQDSGTAAILVYTTPLWVMPISIFFFREPGSFLKWIGFALGLIGILFMLNPQQIDWANPNTLLSLFYLISASLSLSIGILCSRYMKWHHSPIELIPWQLLIACILLVVIAFLAEPHPHFEWNMTSTLCLFFTGLFATAFGFLGMSKVCKELPPTFTSIGFLGVPVSGVIFSVIMLHEAVDLYKILAMLFIALGVVCVVLGEKKPDESQDNTSKKPEGQPLKERNVT